jgi:hypothetical protein
MNPNRQWLQAGKLRTEFILTAAAIRLHLVFRQKPDSYLKTVFVITSPSLFPVIWFLTPNVGFEALS